MTGPAFGDALARARSLTGLGRQQAALEPPARVLATGPEHVEALGLQATSVVQLEREREALRVLDRLKAASPVDAFAHGSRRCAGLPVGLVGALRSAREAVRLGPTDPTDHVQVAIIAHDIAAYRDEARAAAERAVELAPHDPNAHFAVTYTARRNRARRAAYRRALALDPQHAAARTAHVSPARVVAGIVVLAGLAWYAVTLLGCFRLARAPFSSPHCGRSTTSSPAAAWR